MIPGQITKLVSQDQNQDQNYPNEKDLQYTQQKRLVSTTHKEIQKGILINKKKSNKPKRNPNITEMQNG